MAQEGTLTAEQTWAAPPKKLTAADTWDDPGFPEPTENPVEALLYRPRPKPGSLNKTPLALKQIAEAPNAAIGAAVRGTGAAIAGIGQVLGALGMGENNPAVQLGTAIHEFGQGREILQPGEQGRVGEFLTHTLPGMAGGVVPVVAAEALTGPFGAAAAGAAIQGEMAYWEARAAGADDQTALKAGLANSALGVAGAVPVMRWFGQLGPVQQTAARRLLFEGALGSVIFGANTVAANAVAQQLYDPERKLTESVGESMLGGGILSGLGGLAQRGLREKPQDRASQDMAPESGQEAVVQPAASGEAVDRSLLLTPEERAQPVVDAAQVAQAVGVVSPTEPIQPAMTELVSDLPPVTPEGPSADPLDRIKQFAAQALQEGESTEIGTKPNPLASTMEDPQARALQRGVREERAATYEPVPIAEQRKQAEQILKADRPAAERDIFAKIERGDALNEVETQAANIIQSEKVLGVLKGDGSHEDYTKAVELNWAYQDARATAGRTLGTIHDALRTPKEHLADLLATPAPQVQQRLKGLRDELRNPATTPERKQFIKARIKSELSREAAKLAEVHRELVEAGLADALEGDNPAKDIVTYARIARIVSQARATGWDMAMEGRASLMVSGPLSQKANILGNAANTAYDQHVRRVVGGMIGSAFRRTDTATVGEIGAFYRHFFESFMRAGRYLTLAYKHEVPVFEVDLHRKGVPVDLAGGAKEDFMTGPKIPGVLGRIIRAPGTTSLLAFDEAQKQFAYGLEAPALAYRAAKKEGLSGEALEKRMGEILADYSHPIHLESFGVAKKGAFQDEGGILLQRIMLLRGGLDNLIQGPGGEYVPLGRLLVPFLKTTGLVFKVGLGIPLQPLKTLNEVRKGTYKGNPARAVDDAARTLMSLAVTGAIVSTVLDEDEDGLPLITGTGAGNLDEKALQYRTAPPYTIKIGGTRYDYRRIEPAAVAIATIVDLANEFKANPSAASMGKLLNSVVDQAADKTFLRTVGDIIEALKSTENENLRTANLIRDTLVMPFIPNIIRQPLRESDPNFRQTPARKRADNGRWSPFAESFGALSYLAWPSAKNAPPIKYDLWGRPMERPYPGVSGPNRFLLELISPLPESAGGNAEPVKYDLMLLRYNDKVRAGKAKDERAQVFYPKPPDYAYIDGGKRHWWTDEQYAEVQQLSGKYALEKLGKINQLNAEDPEAKDIDMMTEVFEYARARAKLEVLRKAKKADKQ